MKSPTNFRSRNKAARGLWTAIILTAFVAGTLDMLGAIIVYKADPGRMFRFIASGAFGAGTAFSGGTGMVWYGIVFHYIIAFVWTILFYWAYPALPFLQKNKYLTGILYGILIWIVMNKIVIPLSAITPGPVDLISAATGSSILIVAVGLPVALLAHRYYSRKGMLHAHT